MVLDKLDDTIVLAIRTIVCRRYDTGLPVQSGSGTWGLNSSSPLPKSHILQTPPSLASDKVLEGLAPGVISRAPEVWWVALSVAHPVHNLLGQYSIAEALKVWGNGIFYFSGKKYWAIPLSFAPWEGAYNSYT